MLARSRLSLLFVTFLAAGIHGGLQAGAQETANAVLPSPAPMTTGAITPMRAAKTSRAERSCGAEPRDWLHAMIGQMLMFGFQGTSPGQEGPRRIARQLCNGTIGGVVLLGHNVKSAAQVKRLTALFGETGASMLPLIAVDQEGGEVQRLGPKAGYRRVPEAATIARRHNTDKAFSIYSKAAAQVRAAGFNVNLGPVVDVNINPSNPIIGQRGRSYGRKPETVIAFARSFVAAHHHQGVLTALKHFPGHGSSKRDSHKSFVDISRSWKRERELAPYAAMANDTRYGDMVMSGHLYHRSLSGAGRYPATLSAKAINGLLRGELGYRGVVITDDLEMAAVRKRFGLKETVIRAVKAGNDILLISNSADPRLDLPERVSAIIAEAVSSGEIEMSVIEASFHRISALKSKLGVLRQQMVRRRQ